MTTVTVATMATKTTPRTPNDSDAKEFNKWATSPAAWCARAEQLQQSSELLWSSIRPLFDTDRQRERADPNALLHAPAYMPVAGFAIEAMLKAAAISHPDETLIYELAKATYLRARDAEHAWTEPTGLGDYRNREAVWMATCTEWLRVVRPALIDHAQLVAAGDRGVLNVNVDVEDMRAQLSARAALVTLEPIWLPADEFIAIVGAREGVGADTGRRWAEQLAVMDAAQDVALFVHSTPDADGRWFSRCLFLKASDAE